MDLSSDSRIKVIYGPSYVGKTTLLRQFRAELVKSGVPEETITIVSFDRGYNLLESSDAYLNTLLNACRNGKRFLFVDSAQLSPGYVEVLSSFRKKMPSVNVYVTVCSNSVLAAGKPLWEMEELAVGIPLYPFTFREYLVLHPGDKNMVLSDFMRVGGIPLMYKDLPPEDIILLNQSYAHLVLNMLIMRESKINPVAMGELLFYIVANLARPLTMKELIEHSSIVDNRTLEKYLQRFTDSGILYACEGYQVDRGMKPSAKTVFFSNDLLSGTLFTPRGMQPAPTLPILYNIVYVELRVRGFFPSVLMVKGMILGLCVTVNGVQTLIRVAETVDMDRSSPTFSAYRSSSLEKMLLTLETSRPDFNRYSQRNIADFLLSDSI